MRWITTIILALLMTGVAGAIKECQTVMTSSDIPCLLVSSWEHNNPCNTYQAMVYNSTPALLDTRSLGTNQIAGCNITFNYSRIGTYIINDTAGDYAVIKVEEDSSMLIALVIGLSLIVALFIILTFAVREEKPFLANFFFLGIFIFSTVLSNLIWKITYVNDAPYEPIMFVVYRIMLIITMLMIFIVLVLVTNDAVQIRKIKGNPIDHYHDNLGKNE